MNHVLAIGQLIKSISKSDTNHAVLIEGPPGFGKTTAVDQALKAKGHPSASRCVLHTAQPV